jgi:ABC-type transport system involved in multi-copper enzyme maturation permease subunit
MAELTFREARRRKILWVALGLGAAFVVLYGVGFYFIVRDFDARGSAPSVAYNSGLNMVTVAAYYVVSFLGVMLAVLTSVGTLAGEVQSQTIQSLAVKPFPRSAIVLGKWLGLSLMMAAYLILLSAGIALVTWAIADYVPPSLVKATAFIIFQAVIMISLSILGGTRLSTVANGVLAFMLYGLAFIGGWIEQIGALARNDAAVQIGIISSLIVPSEAMWKIAADSMQSAFVRSLGMSPFASTSAPSLAMVAYAVVYTVALVALAVRSFSRRDL